MCCMFVCDTDIPHMNHFTDWSNIVDQVNRSLQLLVPSVCELRSDYQSLESCTETADRDNVSLFLSRLNLDEYHVAEEHFTKELTGLTKKQFFEVSMLPLQLWQIAGVISYYLLLTNCPSVLWPCWLGIRKSIRPAKIWVVRCWRGYLSGVRCRLFAYGPADATVSQNPITLPHLNLDLPRSSWKRGR